MKLKGRRIIYRKTYYSYGNMIQDFTKPFDGLEWHGTIPDTAFKDTLFFPPPPMPVITLPKSGTLLAPSES
jgi:hypothetical protein